MLIIIAAYTANLASFLTVKKSTTKLESFLQLAQSDGEYSVCIPEGQGHEAFLDYETEHYGYKFQIKYAAEWEDCMEMVADGEVPVAPHRNPPCITRNTLTGESEDTSLWGGAGSADRHHEVQC